MLGIITKISLGIGLGSIGVFDCIGKKIPVYMIVAMAAVGTGLRIIEGSLLPMSWMMGMIPGAGLLIVSILSKEQIGYGDALVIGVLAWYLPLNNIIEVLCIAFFLVGIAGVIIRMFLRDKGIERIPFIPFLFGAYLLCIL